MDSSYSFWLMNSDGSCSWIRVVSPTWRSLQGTSALDRDLTRIVRLLRFPVCVNYTNNRKTLS